MWKSREQIKAELVRDEQIAAFCTIGEKNIIQVREGEKNMVFGPVLCIRIRMDPELFAS
jgi:hypothetical protein